MDTECWSRVYALADTMRRGGVNDVGGGRKWMTGFMRYERANLSTRPSIHRAVKVSGCRAFNCVRCQVSGEDTSPSRHLRRRPRTPRHLVTTVCAAAAISIRFHLASLPSGFWSPGASDESDRPVDAKSLNPRRLGSERWKVILGLVIDGLTVHGCLSLTFASLLTSPCSSSRALAHLLSSNGL